MCSAALGFVFVFLYSSRGQISISALTPSRLSIGWGMETRGRAKLRATTSPPRAATVGGTQSGRDVFVDPPSSAIGLYGDGKVSSRSTSLEAGPRSTCRQPSVVRVRTRNMGQPRELRTRKIANLWILCVAILSVLPPQTSGGILHK